MLNIQVLGTGIIPRKGFLAPHKEPFPAELKEIGLILRERNLSINYLNPDSGEFVPLNRNNLMSVWNQYGKKRPVRPSRMKLTKSTQPPMSPSVPQDRKIDTAASTVQTAPQDDIIIPKSEAPKPAVTTPPNDDIVITEKKTEVEVKEEIKEEVVQTEPVSRIQPGDIVISAAKEKTTDVVIEDKVITEDIVEKTKEEKFTPQYGKKKRR